MSHSQRLQILSEEEIDELYAQPAFNDAERSHFFSLPEKILIDLNIKKINHKKASPCLYFILQYGYFKAKHQFFNLHYSEVKEDVIFIMQQYMLNDQLPTKLPSRKIQHAAHRKILKLMGFKDDKKEVDKLILKKVSYLARTTHNLLDIFEKTIQYLDDNSLVLPNYSRLQDGIGSALNNEKNRIKKLVNRYLTKKARQSLEALLQSDEGLYRITALKFDAKSFQTKEMKAELKKLGLCKPISDFSKTFLPKLKLSRGMVEHYADLALYYNVNRLKSISQDFTYLYLICYVQYRNERLINNLIQAFIYYVDKYHDEAKRYAKNKLPLQVKQIEDHYATIGTLIGFYLDKNVLSLNAKKLQSMVFEVIPEDQLQELHEKLSKQEKKRKKREQKLIWEYHKSNYQSLLINLRPLFLAIDFESNDRKLTNLFEAIKFLKSLLNKNKNIKDIAMNRIPSAHIKPKYLLNYFMKTIKTKPNKSRKVINLYQYEFHLYRLIRENLRKSKVHVNNSISYKSFEAEVNIDPNWEKREKEILKSLNNDVLLSPIDDILAELESILEPLIEKTNQRIANGENKRVNITHHRDGTVSWTLPYPSRNDEVDNPFYDQLEVKTISEIFDFADQECGFMKKFHHIKEQGTKITCDYLGVKATLLANGTMQGTHEFSKRSNLKYRRLQLAEQNHVRLETVRNAADVILNKMINLDIFDAYDLDGKKHGSADGTKKKTRRRLFKARHSPKYFGLEIGMVIMTMHSGYAPIITEVIGANEHESHYTYPLLRRNSSMIDPDIISTDTAGANNVNDFLYYLIGKVHAPCYRSVPNKAKSICGFKPLSHYKEHLIRPTKNPNTKLIKEKWPELLPVLVSLLSHETNQENIIKKLSSHEYKSDLKDAFWELNNILKSIHILKYIDDLNYCRNIRTALNRGEAYHQLIAKIAAVGGGDFRGMSELEVEIWNECNRLIALIIIYYNMHLLSKLYENPLAKEDEAALEFLRHISPLASQHINIGGLYEFNEVTEPIRIDHLVELLGRILNDVVKSSPDTLHTKGNNQYETV